MAAKKKPSFEESMHRLEEIVAQLERGEIPLELSMTLFDEGTKLSMSLSSQLDVAEQKLTIVRASGIDQADVTEQQFTPKEE